MRHIDPNDLEAAYQMWLDRIESTHHGANHRINPEASFAPLTKPLADSTMALVTTAGVHLDTQEPFHVDTVAGDASWREIPHNVDLGRLRFTHTHYDTASAEQDPNVVLPIDRLTEAAQAGRVGSPAQFHIGMMGFNPDPSQIAGATAPAVAQRLADAEVDVVLLVPG